MDDLERHFSTIFGEEAPTVTVPVLTFGNSPRTVPVVLRLVTEEQDNAVRAAVGKNATDEEKAAAWIREPLVHSLVSIDGLEVPDDAALRRRVLMRWHKPIIATLYAAYRDLDSAEMEAQQAVLRADPLPGADSGPSSAPREPGATADSPGAPSPTPAGTP